jgi:hypothetical protein
VVGRVSACSPRTLLLTVCLLNSVPMFFSSKMIELYGERSFPSRGRAGVRSLRRRRIPLKIVCLFVPRSRLSARERRGDRIPAPSRSGGVRGGTPWAKTASAEGSLPVRRRPVRRLLTAYRCERNCRPVLLAGKHLKCQVASLMLSNSECEP